MSPACYCGCESLAMTIAESKPRACARMLARLAYTSLWDLGDPRAWPLSSGERLTLGSQGCAMCGHLLRDAVALFPCPVHRGDSSASPVGPRTREHLATSTPQMSISFVAWGT